MRIYEVIKNIFLFEKKRKGLFLCMGNKVTGSSFVHVRTNVTGKEILYIQVTKQQAALSMHGQQTNSQPFCTCDGDSRPFSTYGR